MNRYGAKLVEFSTWMAVWVIFSMLISLTPMSEWLQGAITAATTFILHQMAIHKSL